MRNYSSTTYDNEQSDEQDPPRTGRQTPIDPGMIEWFCRATAESALQVCNTAGLNYAMLVLSSFGEFLAAGSDNWKNIAPLNKAFALGQNRSMADQAGAWATEPGRNVYFSMTLYPPSLGNNKRGEASAALGVFGLGADLDGDKGCSVRVEDLPLPPTLVISSSRVPRDNYNVLWLFDRVVPLDEVRPIAKALAVLVGDADGGTADPSHVWRVPGTLNWPKKTKVARGRPLAPQLARVEPHVILRTVSPEALRDALEVALEDKLSGKTIAQFFSGGPRSPSADGRNSRCGWSGDHWTSDMPQAECELWRDLDALTTIPPDCARDTWRKIVAAIADRHLGSDLGRNIALAWSLGGSVCGVNFRQPDDTHTLEAFEACWLTACQPGHFSIGTAIHFAKQAGWNSSRARWGLGRAQRPGKPLSRKAQRVLDSAQAMPRKNPNLERIAWFWMVLSKTRRPDLRDVAFVLAFSINATSGFAWRTFESIANVLHWQRGRKGRGFQRVSRAVRDLAQLELIVRSPGNERGAHGRNGPSFALRLPGDLTWEACIKAYTAEFGRVAPRADDDQPEQAATDLSQGGSKPEKKGSD